MRSMFRSFAIHNYRLWFGVTMVSNIGSWMQRTAQDWIVLTQLTDNNAAALGVTVALQFGPQLLLMPVTGLVSDLFDRRRILVITQASMLALAAGLSVLTLAGLLQLSILYAFALALGVVSAFDAPARQTFVSSLVPHSHLSNAVSLNAAAFNGARLAGPAAAGLLTAVIGAGWVFLVNALTFAVTIAGVFALRRRDLSPQQIPDRKRGQLVEGFAYVRSRPDIALVFVMISLFGSFGMNFAIYNPTMSVLFGHGVGEFGLLSSVMAIGSLAGALIAARWEQPRIGAMAVSAASFGVALGAASLAPSFWTYAALVAIAGLCAMLTMNTANAYVQTATDSHVRGRVMSLYMGVFLGGSIVGSPVVGWVVDVAGPRWALAVGASAGLIASGIAATSFLIAKVRGNVRIVRARRATESIEKDAELQEAESKR